MDGDGLRAAREQRGWSREELAVASGVDVATIRRTETGETRPQAATMRRMLAALAGAEVAPAPREDAELGRIVRAWQEADARGRRALAAVADVVAGFGRAHEAAVPAAV